MKQSRTGTRGIVPRAVLSICLLLWLVLSADRIQAGSQTDPNLASGNMSPASAETAAVTGRHAPATEGPSHPRFAFGIGVGILTSGDLFKLEVVDRNPQPWLSPAGQRFNSEEYVVTLDEDFLVGTTVSYRFAGNWQLRGELSYAKADATAEALVGQTVELFLYDRLAFLIAGLSLEKPLLVSGRSYPFLLVGAAWVDVKADGAKDLDQNGLGWLLGLGYHHNFNDIVGLRLEVRDTIYRVETSGHEPVNLNPSQPEIIYERYGPQHLFNIALVLQVKFDSNGFEYSNN